MSKPIGYLLTVVPLECDLQEVESCIFYDHLPTANDMTDFFDSYRGDREDLVVYEISRQGTPNWTASIEFEEKK